MIVMEEYLNVMKALSDSNRVRAICALKDGELCVCQLIELLGLAPSTVSKHLSILQHAGLVRSRKNGRWVLYRLADDRTALVSQVLTSTFQIIANDQMIVRDEIRMREIRAMDPEELCR
jgi:DNA-binding transcriptional ArsR family regulator